MVIGKNSFHLELKLERMTQSTLTCTLGELVLPNFTRSKRLEQSPNSDVE